MATAMTPSEGVSREQLGRFLDKFEIRLRGAGFKKEDFQKGILEIPETPLMDELLAVVSRFVAMVVNTIVHVVTGIDRGRKPQEAIDATGRRQYVDREVVATMPRCDGDQVELEFFKLDLSARGGWISNSDLQKEFESRKLVPDPMAQIAFNKANPAFADDHPNATLWKDADGKWCYLAFYLCVERRVDCGRNEHGWHENWWFVGRKCQEKSLET